MEIEITSEPAELCNIPFMYKLSILVLLVTTRNYDAHSNKPHIC